MQRLLTRINNSLDEGTEPLYSGKKGLVLQRARQLRAAGMFYQREQDTPPIAGDCSSFCRECYRFAGFESPDPGRMGSAVIAGTKLVDRMIAAGFMVTESPTVGDVIVFNWGLFPQHVGLITHQYDDIEWDFIHLSATDGKIVESPLTANWKDRFHCYLTLKIWLKEIPVLLKQQDLLKKEELPLTPSLPKLDATSDLSPKTRILPLLEL